MHQHAYGLCCHLSPSLSTDSEWPNREQLALSLMCIKRFVGTSSFAVRAEQYKHSLRTTFGRLNHLRHMPYSMFSPPLNSLDLLSLMVSGSLAALGG